MLAGIHASRLDMGDRDRVADESLGLNAAWYPDILLTLTEPAAEVRPSEAAPAAGADPACVPLPP